MKLGFCQCFPREKNFKRIKCQVWNNRERLTVHVGIYTLYLNYINQFWWQWILTMSAVGRGRYGMWPQRQVSKDIWSFLDAVSEWGWLKPRLWKKSANRQFRSLWLLEFIKASMTELYKTLIRRKKSPVTLETFNWGILGKKNKTLKSKWTGYC